MSATLEHADREAVEAIARAVAQYADDWPDAPIADVFCRTATSACVTLATDGEPSYLIQFEPGKPIEVSRIG